MPLHWTLDSKERLVIVTAEGDVTGAEIEDYIAAMNGAGTMSYRKLYDGSRGDTDLTADELLAIGVQLRARHGTGDRPGPLALVLSPDQFEQISRVLGILAAADRPMRVFSGIAPARHWIERFPK
ncbi:hypothetical protein [Reyranella sp.]|uniref:hypothetical protein n=1 Tax=Reyranella sp. TaxID=1929291 RepID=UPI003BA963A8